jgi:lysophospholipase L1-like esterase
MRRNSLAVLLSSAALTLAIACSSDKVTSGGSGGAGGSLTSDAGAGAVSAAGGAVGGTEAAASGGSPSGGGATPPASGGSIGGAAGTGGGTGGATLATGGTRPQADGGAGGSGAGGIGNRDASEMPEVGRDVGAAGAAKEVGGDGAGAGGVGGTGDVAPSSITVWLAGDSTVANGSTPCPVGWGKQFQSFFGSSVNVVNKAQGGRSVQTWLYDVGTTMGSNGECVLNSDKYLSAWTDTLDGMKPGDFLFIQFGINDTDSTCNRHVGTALFQKYYGMMAQAAKDHGATPIFVTPVSSISCSGSKAQGTRGTYAAATKQAGTTYGVTVIDLEQLSVALYTSLGFCPLPGADTAATFEAATPVGNFFCEDHTHFEAAGAKQIAGLIVKALRDQKIVLANYLL